LYRAAETLRWLAVMLHPVMPEATRNIYRQLGLTDEPIGVDPADLEWGGLAPQTAIGEAASVFPQIDKASVMNEIDNSGQAGREEAVQPAVAGDSSQPADTASSEQPKAEENFITIDDFLKVELRVGEIKVAERIPKADKLLRFEVDLGEEKPRQILAGLAEYY